MSHTPRQDIEYTFHRMLGLGKFTDAGPIQVGNVTALVSTPFESITVTDKWTVVMKLESISLGALIAIFIPGDAIDAMLGKEEFIGGNVDREALERMLGLNVPVHVQYGRWIGVLPTPDWA